MTHTLTYTLPIPIKKMDRIARWKRRMVAKGYAVLNRANPMCPAEASRPTLTVSVSKPEAHISTPIGQLMTWGVVQYGRDTTDTPDRRRPAAA
ncbi:MAG: hypothetical protein ACYC3F_17055 [Gemmatimonadaceae bacterium]